MPARLPAGLTNPPKQVSGDQIAADALRYVGHPYSFGGWDCSSFVNHVLGQDLGLTLPGGLRGYKGPPPHGPVVLSYAGWGSAVSSPARGDLAIWAGAGANGHMGIVLGPDQMISALNPAQGTAVTQITGAGPPGVRVTFRRVSGATAGSPAGMAAGAGGPGAAGAGLAGPALAVLLTAGMAGAVVGGAVLLALGAVALASLAIARIGGSA